MKFSTLIGLEQFDVIGRAMRSGKARFWLNTERFPFLVTLLVKIRGSPKFWKFEALTVVLYHISCAFQFLVRVARSAALGLPAKGTVFVPRE